MKKLKLNLAHKAGEILSKEEMKNVLGGAGSDVKQFYECQCTSPAIGAWEGYYTSLSAAEETIATWCSNQKGFCLPGS